MYGRLAEEYQALNGTHIQVLHTPPSALEFSRLVHISRPVLIKASPHTATAAAKWSRAYLASAMHDAPISVAATPPGQGADALALGPHGETYFTEPHTVKMSMPAFLDRLTSPNQHDPPETLYLQSQNGNLYPTEPCELAPLRADVPPDVPWATDALGRAPDAVNLWIGDSRSVTSVHSDPYENIYTVILGAKHFTLFPPTDSFALKERTYKHARYTRPTPSSPLTLTPTPSHPPVPPWPPPSEPLPSKPPPTSPLPPHTPAPPHPPSTTPLHLTLHAGQTLYLPPGWWHHVTQSPDATEHVCVALNWWYDMEMGGAQWVWLRFLRGEGEEGEEGGMEVRGKEPAVGE
ncbi:Clavaminate synthase-like protein [Ramaria rubella]|nr:Clavaminate synthase-like protein [Ramaria rubella]